MILRPATVYGPGSQEVVGEIARAIEGGHMLLVDGGRALAGLCYVENLIDAIVLALAGPLGAGEDVQRQRRRSVSPGRRSPTTSPGARLRRP